MHLTEWHVVFHLDLWKNLSLSWDRKLCLVLGCTFCWLVVKLYSIGHLYNIHFSKLNMVWIVQTLVMSHYADHEKISQDHWRSIPVRNQCLFRWSVIPFRWWILGQADLFDLITVIICKWYQKRSDQMAASKLLNW